MFRHRSRIRARGYASTPYPLSFSALGLTGVAGYVYDGTVSRAWTDNGMTTLASASGSDTVAVWEDMSGNGSHAPQATTANRCVWYKSGGIQSVKGGHISGVARYMNLAQMQLQTFTIYAVWRINRPGGGDCYPFIIYSSAGHPNGLLAVHDPGMRVVDGVGNQYAVSTATNAKSSLYVRKASNSSSGAVIGGVEGSSFPFATGVATLPSTGLSTVNYALYADVGGLTAEACFLFMAETALDAGQRATIDAYINSNFASWTGSA